MTTDRYQAAVGTEDACPGCGGEVVLVVIDDGSTRAECPCSVAAVFVAA